MRISLPPLARSLILICLSLETVHSQTPSRVDVLRSNLSDGDIAVRLSAASELAEFGPDAREAIPELIVTLKDRHEEVRLAAVEALAAIGKDAVQPLIQATNNENVDVRWGAAEAIRRIGPDAKAALPQLAKLLEDGDKVIRLRAAYAMGIFGPDGKAAVPILIDALKDSVDERTRAVEALERIGVAAIPQLIPRLEDQNLGVRNAAADAVGKIGIDARDAVPSLLKGLKHSEPSVRRQASNSLGNFWPDAETIAPALMEILNDSDPTVVKAASHSLARLGQSARAAIPSLTNLSRNHSTLIRRSAAEALGDISDALYTYGSTSDIKPLSNAYQVLSTAEDAEVKRHAARIKRTLDYLNLIWWGDIAEWPLRNPYMTLGFGVYPSLLLVCLILFVARPSSLLTINEKLSSTVDFELPSWLSGNRVPVRYVLLVGFFHYRPRVLDAWVTRHLAQAQKQFPTMMTVDERRVHVASPVLLDKQSVPNLTAQNLHPTFSKNRTCLLLLGEGGSGKTSLACQLAKWAMADVKQERLAADYCMLPVLIEQQVGAADEGDSSLLSIIRNQLAALIDASDPPAEALTRELLRQKRLLVVIDSFSEMSEPARANVLAAINDLRINACIITSRTDVKLNTRTLIEPQRIRGNQLSSFMDAYLVTLGKRALFDDDEFFDACKRLSLMVGDRDVTALLAKSYADQMIAAKDGGDEALPENIPDLMISYVSALARPPVSDRPDIGTVIWAAKVIAWGCVSTTFRPTATSHAEVLKLLGEKGPVLFDYLKEKLRIVQVVGAAEESVRLSLDPLAEYLAALHVVEEFGNDENQWKQFIEQADQKEGAPDSIKGFLLAVRDCCLAKPKAVPDFVPDELAKRAGLDPEDRKLAYQKRRTARMFTQMKSGFVEERIEAVRDLTYVDSEASTAALARALSDPEPAVRRQAALAFTLPRTTANAAIPTLLAQLKDEEPRVRQAVTYAFFKLAPKDKEVVYALVETLDDVDRAVVIDAAKALVKIIRSILPLQTVPSVSTHLDIPQLKETAKLALAELENR